MVNCRCLFLLALSGTLGLFPLLRDIIYNKKIALWLADAVEVTVYTKAKKIDRNLYAYSFVGLFVGASSLGEYLLVSEFSYQHKHHTIYSLDKARMARHGLLSLGSVEHVKMVNEYANCRFKALYSPNYDRLMFVKGEIPVTDSTVISYEK